METMRTCPECGAVWPDENTCQDHFYQMLAWENENPAYGVVHHLVVLSYHLQHPNLYSPEGLREAKQLLAQFLELGLTPAEVRQRNRTRLDSSRRNWKIKGTVASHGSYGRPIQWIMTAADVIAAGSDNYCDNVNAWAQSVWETLK